MKYVLIFLGAVLVIALVARMAIPGDQKRISRAIAAGCAAVEKESVDDIMSVISLSYRDEYGLSYMALRQLFSRMFGQFESIQIHARARPAAVGGDTARVVLDIWSTGVINGRKCSIIGTATAPEKLTLVFVRGDFGWKVADAQWESFPSIESLIDKNYFGPGGI